MSNEATPYIPLEGADQAAVRKILEIPTLAFDADSRRGGIGDAGGFYFAHDDKFWSPDIYEIDPKAINQNPGADYRQNSPKTKFPVTHFGQKIHIAIVAAGNLVKRTVKKEDDKTKEEYYFSVIALVKEVTDKRTGKPALVRIVTNKVPAVKLYTHLIINSGEALERMTKFYHEYADTELAAERMTTERHAALKKMKATMQLIWMPIRTVYDCQIGRDNNNCQLGALPLETIDVSEFRDAMQRHEKEKIITKKLWEVVPTSALVKPAEQGGLLLPRELADYCRNNRLEMEGFLQGGEEAEPEAGKVLPFKGKAATVSDFWMAFNQTGQSREAGQALLKEAGGNPVQAMELLNARRAA